MVLMVDSSAIGETTFSSASSPNRLSSGALSSRCGESSGASSSRDGTASFSCGGTTSGALAAREGTTSGAVAELRDEGRAFGTDSMTGVYGAQ